MQFAPPAYTAAVSCATTFPPRGSGSVREPQENGRLFGAPHAPGYGGLARRGKSSLRASCEAWGGVSSGFSRRNNPSWGSVAGGPVRVPYAYGRGVGQEDPEKFSDFKSGNRHGEGCNGSLQERRPVPPRDGAACSRPKLSISCQAGHVLEGLRKLLWISTDAPGRLRHAVAQCQEFRLSGVLTACAESAEFVLCRHGFRPRRAGPPLMICAMAFPVRSAFDSFLDPF